MEAVIDEILIEIKERCALLDYEYIQNLITVKLHDYDLIRREPGGLVKYEMTESQRWYQMFFVAKKIQGLSQRSLVYYKTILDQVLGAINKPLDKITTDDVRYYFACYQMKNNVSKVTLDNNRRILNSFFQWLEDEEYIHRNPIRKIKKTKMAKVIKKAFTYEEIEKLKMTCKSKRNIALIEFLLSTGARVDEVQKLNKDDINFRNNEVKVVGKGNKERIVYLNASASLRLREYLESRTDDKDGLFIKYKAPYSKLTIAGIQKVVRDLGVEAGVENVHPHRFRRTCATIANKRGMKIEEIQKMLGHEDIRTTTIYVQVDEDDVKKSHEKYMN